MATVAQEESCPAPTYQSCAQYGYQVPCPIMADHVAYLANSQESHWAQLPRSEPELEWLLRARSRPFWSFSWPLNCLTHQGEIQKLSSWYMSRASVKCGISHQGSVLNRWRYHWDITMRNYLKRSSYKQLQLRKKSYIPNIVLINMYPRVWLPTL